MFQFTIRDLLWLIVVVAMGVAWLVDHHRLSGGQRLAFRAHTMEEVLKAEGWIVEQDEDKWFNVRIHTKGGNEYEWGSR